MDEARLTPQMGRLIDSAKAAAARAGCPGSRAEGVALLAGDGAIYDGCAVADPTSEHTSAAEGALEAAQQAGCVDILAAAVAVANDPAGTALPGAASRRVLAGIAGDLPLVVKQRGRWVMMLLSEAPDPT
ncbi:MAG: hypothetical protein GXY46_01005 [Actinobacteria bacterium]|nr:hypothetical protein [Actinomycetota bacterium]